MKIRIVKITQAAPTSGIAKQEGLESKSPRERDPPFGLFYFYKVL
jgi:hypothetical protein